MKPLDLKYKAILQRFAEVSQKYVSQKVHDPRVVIYPIRVFRTDTFGWYVDVFRLRKIPGALQLWLDLFPNVGRPILAVCYYSRELNRVKKVANAHTNHPHAKPDLSSQYLGPYRTGGQVLLRPLSRSLFGKPLVESYESNFFTVYFPDEVSVRSGSLRRKACGLMVRLIRSVASALEGSNMGRRDYPGIRNRTKVVRHLVRERSSSLAIAAKIRDGFTCRVCGFNFAETFGDLGRGFAEAHHIIPLSNLKEGTRTNVDDLICVCSNCHRMLHRMDGHPDDVKRLRHVLR